MIRRKVFSSYSEEDLISAIEERAFNEGYQAAQREFAEEEEEARERKRKIGVGLTGLGGVGAGVGLGKTLYDIHGNNKYYNEKINRVVADYKKYYDDYTKDAYKTAEDAINSADLKKRIKFIKYIEEKYGKEATDKVVEGLNRDKASYSGEIIKSSALKHGLPALAVTGIGAGMMYKNRKKDKKK